MLWRLGLVFLAAVAAIAPLPAQLIERTYAAGIYPRLQRLVTAASNSTATPLFDLLIAGVVLFWLGMLIRDVSVRRRIGWGRVAGRTVVRTALVAAAVYLFFLLVWGLNYRRSSLAEALSFDAAQATSAAALALAEVAVDRLNQLHADAHADPAVPSGVVDGRLAAAFHSAQTLLGMRVPIQPSRPKHTLLDRYFRAVGVDGMTAPFFLETLVPSDLLDVERPAIVAHEWGHLSGVADEGEASFVAWLACLQGDGLIEYSGWLSIFGETMSVLPDTDRRRISARLAEGPRADLRAMAERRQRNRVPSLARAGWRVYDGYLRANRIESGTASYGEVLQLVLGTSIGRRHWEDLAEDQSSITNQPIFN